MKEEDKRHEPIHDALRLMHDRKWRLTEPTKTGALASRGNVR